MSSYADVTRFGGLADRGGGHRRDSGNGSVASAELEVAMVQSNMAGYFCLDWRSYRTPLEVNNNIKFGANKNREWESLSL